MQLRSKALKQGGFPKEKGNIIEVFIVYNLFAKGFEELGVYTLQT